MAIELDGINSGYSTGKINTNFQKVEDYINNNLLNKDGLTTGEANQMEVPLDMNSFTVYNLPEPVISHQAARLKDVQNALAGVKEANLIAFTPYANIISDSVQGAIQELADGTGQAVTTSTGTQTLKGALDSREVTVNSISDLPASVDDGIVAYVKGFYAGSSDGSARLIFNSSRAKSDHNGVSIIDPSHPVAPGSPGWWDAQATSDTGVWAGASPNEYTIENAGKAGPNSDYGNITGYHLPAEHVSTDTMGNVGQLYTIKLKGSLASSVKRNGYVVVAGDDFDHTTAIIRDIIITNPDGSVNVQIEAADPAQDTITTNIKLVIISLKDTAKSQWPGEGIYSIRIGRAGNATGDNTVSIGDDNSALGRKSVSVGNESSSAGVRSIAVGDTASSSTDTSIAIGDNSETSGIDGIAIGRNASARALKAVACGPQTNANSAGAVSVGSVNAVAGVNSIGIGQNIDTGNDQCIAIGDGVQIGIGSSAANGIAIGELSSVTGLRGIAIGKGATAYSDAIAMGLNATASGIRAVAIGRDVTAAENTITIGDGVNHASVLSVPNAIATSAIPNGCVNILTAEGSNELLFRVRYQNGTLKEGRIALT